MQLAFHYYQRELFPEQKAPLQIKVSAFCLCYGRKGECHSLSYDALTAHVAIVLTRYMLIAMEQCQNEDQRTRVVLLPCRLNSRHYFQQITWHSDGYLDGKPSGNLEAKR